MLNICLAWIITSHCIMLTWLIKYNCKTLTPCIYQPQLTYINRVYIFISSEYIFVIVYSIVVSYYFPRPPLMHPLTIKYQRQCEMEFNMKYNDCTWNQFLSAGEHTQCAGKDFMNGIHRIALDCVQSYWLRLNKWISILGFSNLSTYADAFNFWISWFDMLPNKSRWLFDMSCYLSMRAQCSQSYRKLSLTKMKNNIQCKAAK